jgi:hypothetical protein
VTPSPAQAQGPTCTTLFRAQDLLNGHLARIEAAQRFLATAKTQMLPSTYDSLNSHLSAAHGLCIHHLDRIMAAPASAFTVMGLMGRNGKGPRIDAMIRAVDFQVNKACRSNVHMLRVGRG